MSMGQCVGSLAQDTALGTGTQYGSNKRFETVVDTARPGNVAARFIDKAERTPFGWQGRDLEGLVSRFRCNVCR
ncbi:hypothetical protein [Azospirillum brasilense]|nr:hypothetical protein [Azospirillum brasilense]